MSREGAADAVALNSQKRYLRVTTEGRVVILALGYVESQLDGSLEIWYSGKGEVLRLKNGRIVGTSGLATDWRDVRYQTTPAWAAVGSAPVKIVRDRDEMPGYRFNIREMLMLCATDEPVKNNMRRAPSTSLRWFDERMIFSDRFGAEFPIARYAVDFSSPTGEVVYAEQCLAVDLCLSWQRWSADMTTAN